MLMSSQTQFLFRNMDTSPALKAHAENRLEKLSRFFSDPLKVSCTFEVTKIDHCASFDVTLHNGLKLHASETTENMYSSVDLALAKMERQVRRYKSRISDHQPPKGRVAKIKESFMTESASTAVQESIPEAPAYTVVREKESSADRLSVDEAVMQMNLLHRSFLVFTNQKNDHINVVYRAPDGTYGLIETPGYVNPQV